MNIKIMHTLSLVLFFVLSLAFSMHAIGATGDPVLINEVLASHTGIDDTESSYKYNQIVSRIKYVYLAVVAKYQYDSTRLFLLGFGLVGVLGIRRKVK